MTTGSLFQSIESVECVIKLIFMSIFRTFFVAIPFHCVWVRWVSIELWIVNCVACTILAENSSFFRFVCDLCIYLIATTLINEMSWHISGYAVAVILSIFLIRLPFGLISIQIFNCRLLRVAERKELVSRCMASDKSSKWPKGQCTAPFALWVRLKPQIGNLVRSSATGHHPHRTTSHDPYTTIFNQFKYHFVFDSSVDTGVSECIRNQCRRWIVL